MGNPLEVVDRSRNISENREVGQHEIKVAFPLGTKLLLSVVALILFVVGFLNVTTILLFQEDKRAYTFDSQATEALLAGKEFIHISEKAIETLRIILTSVDPRSDLKEKDREEIKTTLENQKLILKIHLGRVNKNTGTIYTLAKHSNVNLLTKNQLSEANIELEPEILKNALPDLSEKGFSYVNISKVGTVPLIAVILGDTNLKDFSSGMPLAVGYFALSDFGTELKGSNVSIVDLRGNILFDTDPSRLYGRISLVADPLFQASTANPTSAGAIQYQTEKADYLGSYVRPGLGVVALAFTAMDQAMRSTRTLILKVILLCGMTIGLAVIFAIVFAKTLTAPLAQLFEATKQVASGQFNLALPISGRDEIGALSASFNKMSRKISELVSESKERGRIENEIAIASTVQATLIPPPQFKNQNMLIESHYESASECGGDWWGFFGVGDKVAVLIGDATGHGIPSALITAAARSCVSVLHKLAQEEKDFSFSPSSMMSYANRVVFDAASGKIMMTFWVGVFDFSKKTLTYSSAGHNPPWFYKKTDSHFQLTSLMSKGQRLGEARDVDSFQEKTVLINSGDILVLYTDGIIEGTNIFREQFGKNKAREVVESNLANGPRAVIDGLMEEFHLHNRSKSFDDDVTLATIAIY